MKTAARIGILVLTFSAATAAASTAQVTDVYRDPNMDFGSIRTVAVVPFTNLARDQVVADRVRDVFINRLLSTGSVYVLPVGEVARGVTRLELQNPAAPTAEEIVKLGELLKADAVVTGVVREYGEVRAGSSSANIISMSVQFLEAGSGKVVWSASSTEGGISFWNRLFGGGGQPLNKVTEEAIDALFDKLLGPPAKGR